MLLAVDSALVSAQICYEMRPLFIIIHFVAIMFGNLLKEAFILIIPIIVVGLPFELIYKYVLHIKTNDFYDGIEMAAIMLAFILTSHIRVFLRDAEVD